MTTIRKTDIVVPGFRVGHWTHPSGSTGCTVVLADEPALAVADVRGGAPGTREVALLEQGRLVQRVDAVLLTGGSAFGLAAADGVMTWLREAGRGFPTGSIPVPIVAGAVIFDLVGDTPALPTSESGYLAAEQAQVDGWRSGPIGAGAGARAGKLLGRARSTATGLGTSQVMTPAGAVTALIVVNPFGDVVDPANGRILAGARGDSPGTWLDTEASILRGLEPTEQPGENTVIGVVVVDGAADRDALVRVAIAAHDGIARAVRPAHTLFDGDTLFVLSRAEGQPDTRAVVDWATGAQRAVAEAIAYSATAH